MSGREYPYFLRNLLEVVLCHISTHFTVQVTIFWMKRSRIEKGMGASTERRIVGGILRKAQWYVPVSGYIPPSLFDYCLVFLHSHGGTGCGSAHKPFFPSRASFSNPSTTVSPGAYFRYHQHQPSLTSF